MKRNLVLSLLVLAAVSCGHRSGQAPADGAEGDSLATVAPETPKADTVALKDYKGQLPEEPILDIVTSMGTIRVKLYKDTPKHRSNFVRLATSHYYDNVLFHRVIDGFMIQGGDPYTRDSTRFEEWGEGGPGYNVDAEFVPEYTHKRGALAAARRGDLANPMKESSGSQFYLVQNADHCKHLDGEYTVFGEAISGLNVIDRIARVKTDRMDRPLQPVVIRSIRLNADMNKRALQEEQRAKDDATVVEEETTLNVQVADSTTLKQWNGRPLKKREK